MKSKGSIGLAFTVHTRTEIPDQASLSPYALHEISVLVELALGHLRYHLTDVPPQSNSPPESVLGCQRGKGRRKSTLTRSTLNLRVSQVLDSD